MSVLSKGVDTIANIINGVDSIVIGSDVTVVLNVVDNSIINGIDTIATGRDVMVVLVIVDLSIVNRIKHQNYRQWH
jgi:hypothetical protein